LLGTDSRFVGTPYLTGLWKGCPLFGKNREGSPLNQPFLTETARLLQILVEPLDPDALYLRLSVRLTDPFYDIDVVADLSGLPSTWSAFPVGHQERRSG
jgi:hypothetical protein